MAVATAVGIINHSRKELSTQRPNVAQIVHHSGQIERKDMGRLLHPL